jgi:hypothetical protein
MIRTFGVADKTCVIGSVFLPLASTGYPVGNQLDYYHPDLHNAPLPADYVVMLSDDRSLSPDWDVHRALRALQRVYGDGVLPFFTQEISCVIRDESASQNREEFDTALLTGILNRWRKIGYESNDVPGIADGCRFPIHSLQASGISGLIETGVDDHDDEERKNTPESGSPVIVLSWDISGRDGRQLRLSPRCYHSKGLIAPGNLSGFLDDLDRLLERRVPYIPVVLDGDAFDVVAINREIIAALLERPRRHNLVFSRSSDVVRYFNRHRD